MSTQTRMSPAASDAPEAGTPGETSAAALSLLAGLAVLATSMSFGALFDDLRWLPPIAATIVTVTLAGAAFRAIPALLHTGLAVLVQVVAGGLSIIAIAVPESAVLGFLPTTSTGTALWSVLESGVQGIYQTTSPAASTTGFTTLLAIGAIVITVVVDGLSSDIRAAKVAGIPLLLMYLLPMVINGDGLRWWHFALAAAGYLILLCGQYAATRIDGTAVVAAVTALVLAAAIPGLLPATTNAPLDPRRLGNNGSGTNVTVINPFLDLRDNLASNDNRDVLSYRSSEESPGPIRIVTADRFDGEVWEPSTVSIDRQAVAEDGLPTPPGLNTSIEASQESVYIRIRNLDQDHLPAPYPAVRTENTGRSWVYDRDTLNILGDGVKTSFLRYSVDYLAVKPTPDDLLAAGYQSSALSEYTELPRDLPKVVTDTARDIVGDETNAYAQAVALQRYFRGPDFTYTTDAPPDGGNGALADFLETKAGYCVQFSSAMTVMARSLGIPARIAVGFLPGEQQPNDSWDVTLEDAHAWPELYFPGVGWTRFEPTPGTQSGSAPEWTTGATSDDEETTTTTEPSSEPSASEPSPSESSSAPAEAESDSSSTDPAAFALWWDQWWRLLATVILIGVLLLAPALLRALRSARRWSKVRTWDEQAGIAWRELIDSARDYYIRIDPASTPRAAIEPVVARVNRHDAATAEAARHIVAEFEKSAYGAASETRVAEPALGRKDIAALRKALQATSSSWHRVAAFLLPRSLFGGRE
ncbi:DUF3488 and transglutaminase-like domain-containing protein [Saxibacter everestensis]|uniref:DUF3488 and transglutaminase-like domain-containing protein n=1 Tax=Saxibacter everestensis TaxID=2909229 RepID=A0ABY8QYM4_9MICO|nr:DUF3488 and transglutaminase-like domain-containing protein [Brevibacteriaceae bacterium ZFBP1038]